ncbi:MAG: sulfotransferase domain-containing protein [Anaerolineaceae bacterium]|nr:sulfotransferase domain-containing protein [Anaerolineaceae bacterium]
MKKDSPRKILYIAGEGRSGSTILGNILGEIDGFFFVGEAVSIWRHFLMDNRMCACGVPAKECLIWQKIFIKAFDSKSIDFSEMEHLRNIYTRNRFAWKMLFPGGKEKLRQELAEYLRNLESLYNAIFAITGAEIIVDSSKRPTYAFLLGLIPNIQVYTLHLVRDSRGVAYSWGKKKIQQKSAKETVYMHQFNPLKSAWRWNVYNFLTELLLHQPQENFLFMRYEDFIKEPTEALSKVTRLLNIASRNFPIGPHNQVNLSNSHAVWGNPCRFQNGNINLHPDEVWQQVMPQVSKRLVTFLTRPGLRRYHYL